MVLAAHFSRHTPNLTHGMQPQAKCLLPDVPDGPSGAAPPSHSPRPRLAAKLSWGTQQISDCPNPDPSLALPLLWFLTNTGEMFPASIMFHSADCPLPVQTRVVFSVETMVRDRRRRIHFRHRSHPCTGPGCGQKVHPNPEASEHSGAP